MKIEKDEYNGFRVYGRNALIIPIADINNNNDVITAMTKHFVDVPDTINAKIIFLGVLESGIKEITLNEVCCLISNLVTCAKTDEGLSSILSEIVVSVIHDNGVFNVIIGKFNYAFNSDTLISNQVGHA